MKDYLFQISNGKLKKKEIIKNKKIHKKRKE